MEKSLQDVGGLAVQQTRSKASFNFPQRDHHRMFMAKGVSPKGLGEIEEMENEEVSTKMMQSLERFMRSYPSVWSESSMQHLLVDIADTRYASLIPNGEAEDRLRTIINRILVPIANICEGEQGFMVVERQKIQEATLASQRVQEECHLALRDLKQEHDLSRRDLKELAKALEDRMAAEETGRKLSSKENQIQEIQQKQRNLVIRLVCGGRAEFLRWAREEIQSGNLFDLKQDLEQTWGVPDQVEGQMLLISDQCPNSSPAKDSPEKSLHNWMSVMVMLLCEVGLEVLGQAGESFDKVKGPWSIPFVIAGFWIGIARRMTLLAVATLFPQPGMVTALTADGTTSTKRKKCI